LIKLKHYAGVFNNSYYLLKGIGPNFFCFDGSQNFFGFFWLVPKRWAICYFLLFLQRTEFRVDVKDASSGKLLFPLNPGSVL
jgi:hypothetical protein